MRLEPIIKDSIPEILNNTIVGEKIEIHADRLQSFKTTVSRINSEKKTGYKFNYSGISDNYYTATRTA